MSTYQNTSEASKSLTTRFVYTSLGLLFLPLLILILKDKRTFPWDEAFYAAASVSLFRTLQHAPFSWPASMVHALRDRPPAIAYLGQFFVPFGHGQSVQTALLVFVLLTQLLSVLLLYMSLKKVFSNVVAPWIACGLLAAGPLLTGLSYRYLVEPLQLFCVVWLLALAAYQERRSHFAIALHLLSAIAFGLLVKTSTPAFQAPAILYLAYLVVRRRGQSAAGNARVWGLLLGTLLIVGFAAAWYGVNYRAAAEHVAQAASGPLSIYYGSRGGLPAKLLYWGNAFQKSFFWWPLLAVLGLLTPLSLWHRRKALGRINNADILAAICAAWIAVVIIVFARNINEDSRYLLGLAPCLGVLVCWLMAALPSVKLQWAVAALIAVQFFLVTAQSYGLVAVSPRFSPYLSPYVRNPEALRDGMFAALQTADSTPEHQTVVGNELTDFNSVELTFYSAIEGHPFDSWRYVGTDFTQGDPKTLWHELLASGCKYYVYRKHPAAQDADAFNRFANTLFATVSQSPAFVLRSEKSNQRVLVFERVAHGRPRYELIGANGLPISSAEKPPVAPTAGGFQGVAQSGEAPFGILDAPKLGSPVQDKPFTVQGWAASPSGVTRVQVLLDGKILSDASLNFRPDVARAFPTLKSTGFAVSINTASLAEGLHHITIEPVSLSGLKRVIADVPVLTRSGFAGVGPAGGLPFGLMEYPSIGTPIAKENPLRVHGWAVSPSALGKVELLVDGKHVANAVAVRRPDVTAAFPNQQSSGFEAELDLSDLSDGKHRIAGIIFGPDKVSRQFSDVSFLVGSDMHSVPPKDHLPFGALDSPAIGASASGTEFLPVSGWAAANSKISRVEVLMDGQSLGDAAIAPRPDIIKAYPQLQSDGFTYFLDLGTIPAAKHQLAVIARAVDGSSRLLGKISFLRDNN